MSSTPMTFICDRCGGLIEQPEHGWVEWRCRLNPTAEQTHGYRSRIVHADGFSPSVRGCRYREFGRELVGGESVGDAALPEFLGDDGLIRILEKIVDRDLPLEELLELLKRTRLQNYEFARRHFDDALDAGILERDQLYGYWSSADLERVIRWVNGEDENQADDERRT